MTREDIECIIKWFSHIEQLATDGKTANGFQMPTDKILATIKVVAKDSREYVEKFCNDSVPKGLDEAAEKYQDDNTIIRYYGPGNGSVPEYNKTMAEVFKDGWNACKEQMLKNAVNTTVHLETGANPVIEIGVGRFGLKMKDKVKVIIVKED